MGCQCAHEECEQPNHCSGCCPHTHLTLKTTTPNMKDTSWNWSIHPQEFEVKPFLDALANCNCPTWTTIFRPGHEELEEKATPTQALQTVKGKSQPMDEEEDLEASRFFKKK